MLERKTQMIELAHNFFVYLLYETRASHQANHCTLGLEYAETSLVLQLR
jgi:hypothetical protein